MPLQLATFSLPHASGATMPGGPTPKKELKIMSTDNSQHNIMPFRLKFFPSELQTSLGPLKTPEGFIVVEIPQEEPNAKPFYAIPEFETRDEACDFRDELFADHRINTCVVQIWYRIVSTATGGYAPETIGWFSTRQEAEEACESGPVISWQEMVSLRDALNAFLPRGGFALG
jgi:hypothetical protein